MAAHRPVRVLVVDEEPALTAVLRVALELEGWQVRIARTGVDAMAAAGEFAPDIILLDMMLPDLLGTEVVRRLRAEGCSAAVVFLTGRAEFDQRAAAYAAGADDYLTKPFGLEAVIDRLHPIVRRMGLAPSSRRVRDLVIDTEDGLAWRDGRALDLTPLEFELLRELVDRQGTRMSLAQLIAAAARRGVRVPSEFAVRILERIRSLVNAGRAPLLLADGSGWMLAG